MKALGLIELLGYCPAVVALDAALKAAEVSFQQISKIDKGIVSLTVTGEVAAVQAAMDAASAAAGQVGEVLYVHVIPRPHEEVDEMLTPPAPAAPPVQTEETAKAEAETASEPVIETEPESAEDAEAAETETVEAETEETAAETEPEQDTEKDALPQAAEQEPTPEEAAALSREDLTLEQLEAMTVKELRTVARDLNITSMSRKEIRFGKKEDLIASIRKYLTQE